MARWVEFSLIKIPVNPEGPLNVLTTVTLPLVTPERRSWAFGIDRSAELRGWIDWHVVKRRKKHIGNRERGRNPGSLSKLGPSNRKSFMMVLLRMQ
jgi:hypothetical protein